MTENYSQIAHALLHTTTNSNYRVSLTVVSNSMAPIIQPGDRLQVVPVSPHLLRCGDVVVFRWAGKLVTHRLVGRRNQQWYAKGDNVANVDPPISAEAILGRVVAIERGSGSTHRVDLQSLKWRIINRVMGWVGWCGWGVRRSGRTVLAWCCRSG
jgi:signal peptidase I